MDILLNNKVNIVLNYVPPLCLAWYFMVFVADIVTFSTQTSKCKVRDFQTDMASAVATSGFRRNMARSYLCCTCPYSTPGKVCLRNSSNTIQNAKKIFCAGKNYRFFFRACSIAF